MRTYVTKLKKKKKNPAPKGTTYDIGKWNYVSIRK